MSLYPATDRGRPASRTDRYVTNGDDRLVVLNRIASRRLRAAGVSFEDCKNSRKDEVKASVVVGKFLF